MISAAVIYLSFIVSIATGYNIETRDVHIVRPSHIQHDSWFGHGMVLYPGRSGKLTAYVSAPRHMRELKSAANRTLDAPDGAIYKCIFNINSHEKPSCTKIYTGSNSALGMTIQSMGNDQLLVCGPRWKYMCRKAHLPQRMVGVCYMLNTTNLSDKSQFQLSSPCVTDCPGGLDIVFLLDGSGSVSNNDFDIAKNWLIDVMKGFSEDMSHGVVNVGLIQYSGTTNVTECERGILTRFIKIELALKNYILESASEKVLNATKLGQCTLTGDSINATVDEFLFHGRERNAAVMIVITDGRSADDVTKAANHARNNGINMIAVGVGQDFDMSELEIIANNTKQIFTVANFSSLYSILTGLQEAILLARTSYLEGASGNSTSELTQCMMGMSALRTKNNNIYTGAPGACDGKGTVISRPSINLTSTNLFLDSTMSTLMQGNESLRKDSYLGYSMTSGHFRGGGEEWIAIGIPRYYGYGAVALLMETDSNAKDSSIFILAPKGENGIRQLGTYFGHTLLAADINDDGADELIVGAPLHSHRAVNSYDEGYVAIYRGNVASSDMSRMAHASCTFKGFQSNSRFGMSLAKAGDLDRDSYIDIVIGAPGFDNNHGEVVVLFGGQGCPTRHQRISPRIRGSNSHYFGFSVGSVDNSEFSNAPLLVASLPKSGGLVFLRSRPVVDLTIDLQLSVFSDEKSTKLDIIQCAQHQSKRLPCATVQACFQINWRDVAQISNNGMIDVFYELALDTELEEDSKRIAFSENGKQQHRLSVNGYNIGTDKKCVNYSLIMKPSILLQVDAVKFSKPVLITLFVNMSKKFDDVVTSPTLPTPSTTANGTMEYVKHCATKGKCSYDLALHVDAPADNPIKMYTPSEIIQVNVTIENKADPSCFTKLSVVTRTAIIVKINSSCAVLDDDRATISVKDDIFGALLLPDQTCSMEITFSLLPLAKFANETLLEVNFSVFSILSDELKAPDNTPENNVAVVRRNVLFFASLLMKSVAHPGDMHYWRNISAGTTFTSLTEKGIFGGEDGDIVNSYTISNTSPFIMQTVDVLITWPAVTYEEELPVLYLFAFSCQPASICTCNRKQQCDVVNAWKLPYDNFINPNGIYSEAQCKVPWNVSESNADFEFVTPQGYPFSKSDLDCSKLSSPFKCRKLFCELSGLQPRQSVEIVGRFKLWIPTFRLKQQYPVVYVGSTASLNISSSAVFPTVKYQRSAVTSTNQYFRLPEEPEPPRSLNVVIVILISVAIGFLLLGLIIFVCWKCRYFESRYKKKRDIILTEDEQELDQRLIVDGNRQTSSINRLTQ